MRTGRDLIHAALDATPDNGVLRQRRLFAADFRFMRQ